MWGDEASVRRGMITQFRNSGAEYMDVLEVFAKDNTLRVLCAEHECVAVLCDRPLCGLVALHRCRDRGVAVRSGRPARQLAQTHQARSTAVLSQLNEMHRGVALRVVAICCYRCVLVV